ncbi:MAG: PQQ-binding-like beta-propeller repeat protein, partial [Bacteroidetes bacterium]|nr:PQQ-binding-like beta-propeller repeat protein [Bacteroidota bacterium]
TQATEQIEADDETDAETSVAITDTIEISKVTHNGFRGNNSLGISSARKVPISWNLASGKNILWQVPVPRKGYNSPVISGNKVFFSGADEKVRELFCYELSSGKQLWKLEAKNIPGSPSQAPATTDDTGLAASTVATNGKVVCAIFGTGDLICADMDGKQLWAKNLGVPDNSYGFASSLLIYGNLLIIQYDNRNAPRVIALDLATGNQRWAKDRPERNPSWSSPIIAMVNGKPQLILIGNPGVTSYNPNNGEINWRVEAMSGEPAPGPAYANGIVFVATEYATMTAINAADGSVLWKNNEILPEISSPVATKDFVFVATSYGVVASFDPQTGEIIKSMETNADFNASPIIVEGKIYLICTKGKVYIFSAKREFTLITSFETGEKTFATPAFTDRKIVIRTEKSVYCVFEP